MSFFERVQLRAWLIGLPVSIFNDLGLISGGHAVAYPPHFSLRLCFFVSLRYAFFLLLECLQAARMAYCH
jgi:hypothetical protein